MGITVSSAAASKKLITLDTFKALMGITVDTYDDVLNTLIDYASAGIVGFCGREFALETVVETLPGNGDFKLLLSRTPVVAISAITYNGETVSASDYSLHDAEAGIVLNKYRWNDTALAARGLYGLVDQNSRENLYSITYQAGYTLASFEAGTPNLPFDIENACFEIVKSTYMARKRDPNLTSQSVPDVYSAEYAGNGAGVAGGFGVTVPLSAASILNQYRRRFI